MKTKLLSGATLAIFALGLLSCVKPPEPTRTVSYYREHPEERQAMVEHCTDDPGSLGEGSNCVNAKRATAIEDIGSFKKLPPMGLTPVPEEKGAPTPDERADP